MANQAASSGGENVIVNDVLCFLSNRVKLVNEQDLITITLAAYSKEETKEALLCYVSARPGPNPAPSVAGQRTSRRGGAQPGTNCIKAILHLMREDHDNLPVFAAINIDKIPPVNLKSIDGAHIVEQNRDIQSELSSHGDAIRGMQQTLNEVLKLDRAPCTCESNSMRITELENLIAAIRARGNPSSTLEESNAQNRESMSVPATEASSPSPLPPSPSPPPSPTSLLLTARTGMRSVEGRAEQPPPSMTPPLPLSPSPAPLPQPPPAGCGTPPTATPSQTSRPRQQVETGTSKLTAYSDIVRNKAPEIDRSASDEDDEALPSNQEGFVEVSASRRKKRTSKNCNLKIGTGRTVEDGIAPEGIGKLFVSLPFPGSRFPLWRMKERIKRHLGDATVVTCKKRLSTRGNTSPFEIYGNADRLESVLFNEDIWEAKSCLQLVTKNVRLPKDYNRPDEESEKDVQERIKMFKGKGNGKRRLESQKPVQDLINL